jgi:hypothetical protein
MNAIETPIVECWTRLLIPFRIEWRASLAGAPSSADLREIFGADHWDGPTDPAQPTSESKAAHSSYFIEYLEQARRYLFDGSGVCGCFYLARPVDAGDLIPRAGRIHIGKEIKPPRSADTYANRPKPRGPEKFTTADAIEVDPKDTRPTSLRLETAPDDLKIELWLSRLGVGVVSVPFVVKSATDDACIDFRDLLLFHHELATIQNSVWCVTNGAAGIAASGREHIHEQIRRVLIPLRELGRVNYDARGLIYCALKIRGEDHAFRDNPSAESVVKLLSHLAQAHPPTHPGEYPAAYTPTLLQVNFEHITTIDLAGAAHATLVEQTGEGTHGYAEGRLRRCMFEYFPGYLLAILERLSLGKMLQDSAQLVRSDATAAEWSNVRHRALAFRLEGEFAQVSWRKGVQRFHEVSKRVCEITHGLGELRAALDALDREARANEAHQRELEVARHKDEAESREAKMQMIEVFLASVYAVGISHYLGEAFGFGHGWKWGVSLIGVALGSIVVIVWTLTRKRRRGEENHGFAAWPGWGVLIGLMVIVAAYLAFNLTFNRETHEDLIARDHDRPAGYATPVGSRATTDPDGEEPAR